MPKFNQKGIAQIFVILILLVGMIAGVYLVQHPQIFKPKAQENSSPYQDGLINVIDNSKRSFPDNTTDNIFVYLEVKPPTWDTQLSQHNQTSEEETEDASFIRVSLDQNRLEKDSDCEITGDPETNCQEIVIDNPNQNLYLPWVLSQKSGDYHIYVRFFSNQNNTKDSDTPISYKDSSEIGFEVPAIFGGLQTFLATIFDVFRKVPGTAAFNAIATFISQVNSANEQVITLTHTQQLGFNVDLTTSEDGEIEFLYDEEQLSKLDVSLDFFPDPDPLTNEPRLVIYPKANPSEQQQLAEGSLNIILGEVGGRLAGRLINTGATKVANSKAIQTVKSKVKIKATKNEEPLPAAPETRGGRINQNSVGRIAGLPVRNLAKMTRFQRQWYRRTLTPLLRTGQAYVLDPNISRPILDQLITGVENAYRRYGLPELNRQAIMETVRSNWVIVVSDDVMANFYKQLPREKIPAAFATNRFVIVREKYANNPLVLAHEFVHVISDNNRLRRGFLGTKIRKIGIHFDYSTEQKEFYGATMSQIYEIFTDESIADVFGQGTTALGQTLVSGQETSYKYLYPELYDSLIGFVNNLIQNSNGGVRWRDFNVFALTGDDQVLMQKLINSGINPAEFMSQLNRQIDGRKLAQIIRAQRLANQDWVTKNKSLLVPIGAGGGAVGLGLLFTASAHGEELPADIGVINELPSQDIDLSPDQPAQNYLNCTYSQEDSNCPSGTTICTGHTDDSQCFDKWIDECFNLVQCNYDTNLGSSCICSQ